jgi:hypothetical protein
MTIVRKMGRRTCYSTDSGTRSRKRHRNAQRAAIRFGALPRSARAAARSIKTLECWADQPPRKQWASGLRASAVSETVN